MIDLFEGLFGTEEQRRKAVEKKHNLVPLYWVVLIVLATNLTTAYLTYDHCKSDNNDRTGTNVDILIHRNNSTR